MNWVDDLTGASGQERRQWLADKGAALSEKMNYFLGPAAAPVNALAQGAAMISPGADFVDMLQSGNELMGSRTAKDAGMAGLGLGAATLGMAIPGTAKGVGEAVEGAAKGIRAYHGSPHDFDKFDTAAIGTGEGAQAYGHGLYFAEKEGVARSYRDALANKKYMGGDSASPLKSAWSLVSASPQRAAMQTDELMPYVKNAWPDVPDDEIRGAIDAAKAEFKPGKMYEVNINADPADFLDWDAPFENQPKAVRDFAASRRMTEGPIEWTNNEVAGGYTRRKPDGSITKVGKVTDTGSGWKASFGKEELGVFGSMEGARSAIDREIAKRGKSVDDYAKLSGANVYGSIMGRPDLSTGPSRTDAAAQALNEAGVPGIKYLDAGSRGAGDGSRNYVVFDPATIEILKKYGLLGAVGGGMGANALAGGQQDEL